MIVRVCLALEVQLNATEREYIPVGVRIHLIKATRGSYIRTPDGKFFAIRQPPSALENGTKSVTTSSPSFATNPIDQFLSSKNSRC